MCEGYYSTLKPAKGTTLACSRHLPNLVTKKVDLAASPNPYVIVPASFSPQDEAQFIMSIKSNRDVTAKLAADSDDWPTIRVRDHSSSNSGVFFCCW